MDKRVAALVAGLGLSASVLAVSPGALRDAYAAAARLTPEQIQTADGERLFRSGAAGDKQCATCHTDDPRRAGKTKVGKRIEPMAPAVNPQRFTDPKKVEKWFRRNCKDVLARECTAQEKASFIAWLMTLN